TNERGDLRLIAARSRPSSARPPADWRFPADDVLPRAGGGRPQDNPWLAPPLLCELTEERPVVVAQANSPAYRSAETGKPRGAAFANYGPTCHRPKAVSKRTVIAVGPETTWTGPAPRPSRARFKTQSSSRAKPHPRII